MSAMILPSEEMICAAAKILEDSPFCELGPDMAECLAEEMLIAALRKWVAEEISEKTLLVDEPKIVYGFVKDGDEWVPHKPYRLLPGGGIDIIEALD